MWKFPDLWCLTNYAHIQYLVCTTAVSFLLGTWRDMWLLFSLCSELWCTAQSSLHHLRVSLPASCSWFFPYSSYKSWACVWGCDQFLCIATSLPTTLPSLISRVYPHTIKVFLPPLYPWRCSHDKYQALPRLHNFNVCVTESGSLGMRLHSALVILFSGLNTAVPGVTFSAQNQHMHGRHVKTWKEGLWFNICVSLWLNKTIKL